MKTKLLLLICALAIFVLCSCQTEIPDSEGQWGKEKDGLQSRITLSYEPEIEHEVIVHYSVRNVSPTNIVLWDSGFWPNHLVILQDRRGRGCDVTPDGKIRADFFDPGGNRMKNARYILPKGEVYAKSPIKLSELYRLEGGETYKVKIVYEEYQGGWEGRLESNTLRFTAK
jgi:hypothetical protein